MSDTIRHLATGESHISLSLQCRIGRQTISKIIPETCEAIFEALFLTCLKNLGTSEEWIVISKDFETKWNLPHVIGTLDGKHIRIRCRARAGSLYHNYNGFFSMVLLAVCDANYRFIWYDFEQYGSSNDSGVLFNSTIGELLETNKSQIPDATALFGCAYDPLPYFLVGDEIFPLKTYLMRPYTSSRFTEAEAIFNYRHSRARRVIENAFGILCSRWKIFLSVIHVDVKNIEKIAMACLAVHNSLKSDDNVTYCPVGFRDQDNVNGEVTAGQWRREILSACGTSKDFQILPPIRRRRYADNALKIQNCLKDYTNSVPGSLP